jgi:hypothetical protein
METEETSTNDKDNPSTLLRIIEPIILSPYLFPLLKGDGGSDGLAVAEDGDLDGVADFAAP